MNLFEDSPKDQGRAIPMELGADPLQELEDLEKALERYQGEFEEGPEDRNEAGDEDWEMLSSGSE